MSDEEIVEQRTVGGPLLAVVAAALLAALGGLAWSYGLQNHLAEAEKKIAAVDQKNADLTQQLEATNARLRATSETLGQSVGMTQKQIEFGRRPSLQRRGRRMPSWRSSSRRRRSRLAQCRPM